MRRIIHVSVLLAVMAALGGCVEALPASSGDEASLGAPVARPVRSPRAASVALASLDGPPEAVVSRFDADFARAAAGRDIAIAEPAAARYLVRGYLDAASAAGGSGTDVTFLYDIFDAQSQVRLDRVTDTLTLPSTGADAWAMVDDRVMQSLAGRSADRLAAALAETPAARAATAAVSNPAPASRAVD